MQALKKVVDSANNLDDIILKLREKLNEFTKSFPINPSVSKTNFESPDTEAFLKEHADLIKALAELNLRLNAKNTFAAKQFKKEVVQVLKELWDPAILSETKVEHINQLQQKGEELVGASAAAVAVAAIAIVVGAVVGALIGLMLTGGLASIPAAIIGAQISSTLAASLLVGGYLGGTFGVLAGGATGIAAGCCFFYKEPTAAIQTKEEQTILKNFTDSAKFMANFKS